ncbi:MAG TPA: adenylate/guanylate cyclase domain-containing protein [Phototrophicaceae bacterium]|nr:adenylate/guanylate cyclase domain-containing protein [Phototrophicaceae bacterium]
MPDETSRISKSSRAPQSAQEQLRQITQDFYLLGENLIAERATLKPRAVGLPTGSLETLDQVHHHLDRLAGQLMSRHIELRQLRALAETTALINSSLDTDSVLNQVMDTVIQLTGAERGYIMLTNKASGKLEFRVARGIDREQLVRDDFIVSNTIVNQVFSSGEPVLTDNAKSDPRYQSLESIVGYQLRSILCVPLIVRGEAIGVVYCDNRALSALFKTHELNLLKAFANQAAVAIENARLFESARAQLAEITEMRDLMDNIFTSIVSGLITLDGDNVITALNRAAVEITGISEGQAIGAELYEVLPGLDSAFAEKLTRVRQAGTQETFEDEITLEGGNHRYWNIVMSPLQDAEQKNQGIVLVLDDLTEQREREIQLGHVRRYLPLALVENIRSEDLVALGGQEREITVLFADVRGFTTFSERLEPEHLMEIINKYMSVSSDAINLFEGVVDKYMGDAVTGLFNTPLNPQEDHAMRACRAALSMVYDVLALHEILPEDQRLFYGIGIHTGSAVLGNVGSQDRREFAVIGDALETSKLLQENALRGEVVVSPATYELVKDAFDFEALAPRKTKEHVDLAVMYRLIGRKKHGTGPLAE